VIIEGLPELIRFVAQTNLGAEAAASVSTYRNIVLAVVMIAMMAFRPEGIIPSKAMAREVSLDKADPQAEREGSEA
jgi:ABC-type branched-subunit amino acid transport system permease subunit